jgi:hypothetical protein
VLGVPSPTLVPPLTLIQMNRRRLLILPLVVVGISYLCFPLAEIFIGNAPFHFGIPKWRFGVAGVISGGILVPAVGMLFLLGAAVLSESRLGAWTVFWLSALMALLVSGLIVSFGLDVLQLKREVPANDLGAFKRAAVSGLSRDVFAWACFVAMAISARRLTKLKAAVDTEPAAGVLFPRTAPKS